MGLPPFKQVPTHMGANGSTSVVPVMAVTETSVETPEGLLVTIQGDFDAEITYRGQTVRAEDPVLSEVVGPNLEVRAGNLPRTRFPLAEITSVEVSQVALVKTILLVDGIILVVGALATGIALAAIN